jgi:hypothetical protein
MVDVTREVPWKTHLRSAPKGPFPAKFEVSGANWQAFWCAHFGKPKSNFQRADFFKFDYTWWRPLGASHYTLLNLIDFCVLQSLNINIVMSLHHALFDPVAKTNGLIPRYTLRVSIGKPQSGEAALAGVLSVCKLKTLPASRPVVLQFAGTHF